MKRSLATAMSGLALLFSQTAHAANLHENREIHETLIAAQELIALGCIGKLGITPSKSGSYSPATLTKIQECADTEGTDIAAKILGEQRRGEIEKVRAPTHMLHYAVLFAKKHNTQAQGMSTNDLITVAKKRGEEHYPYTPKSLTK